MKPATACIAVGLLVAGCAGQASRPPTTEVTRIPKNGDWFCQLAPSGEGWQCVQDEELAENPRPARLPEPLGEPAPLPLPDTGPSVGEPVQDAPQETPGEAPGLTNEETTAPAPAPAASAAPAGDAAPAYARLAYEPGQPMALTDLPDDFYAVQVLAMSTREQLEAFVRRHDMEGMPAARVERDGEIYYVLLLGVYETLDRAQRAVGELPAPFDETAPWIRPLGSLKSAMLRAEQVAAAGASGAAGG